MADVEEHRRRVAVDFTRRRGTAAVLRSRLKDTLFPDDPFRGLSGQPPAKKVVGVLRYFLPILEWLPRYSLLDLRYDVLAGITITSLAIPQGISYARLAGVPPIIGLYSSFVPPLIYPIFGSSKHVAVGTVAAGSLLLSSVIGNEVSATANPTLYLHLFFTAALFTGIFELALGIFRLGILVDFFSRSTITGFMSGTAILIILQQLKGMLGMTDFTSKTDLVSVMHAIFKYRHEWRWESAVLGLCFLCFLLLTRHVKEKAPKLFWVSAVSPLLVVIFGCVFAFLVHGEDHGIPIVGPLKKGLNPISIGDITFESQYLTTIIKAGLISGFLALAEGIAVGRSLAMLKNDQIDGNKEMIAFGIMNIIGSFFSCYMTTGPFSKSAVNYHAGSRTPMANIVMSVCMMLVLLFLAPLFKYTPLVALSTIIIVAMIGLIEFEKFKQLYKTDKFDFCVCLAAFLGVVFVSMVVGLMISVGLSILRALLYVARPSICKLGNFGGPGNYHDIEQYPDASCIPGILILQLGSPIYFANASYLRERIFRWIEDEEGLTKKNGGDLQYVILEMGGVTSIDSMGTDILKEVHKNLDKKGIKVALANPRLEVVEKLVSSNCTETLGADWVFVSVDDAIYGCRFSLQESNSTEVQGHSDSV